MAVTRVTQQARQSVSDEHQDEPNRSDEERPPSSRPAELLEIGDVTTAGDDEIVYPSGIKVWLALGALYTAYFLNGLVRCWVPSSYLTDREQDLTIVAVAVPSLTNSFHTVDDIAWYSAA